MLNIDILKSYADSTVDKGVWWREVKQNSCKLGKIYLKIINLIFVKFLLGISLIRPLIIIQLTIIFFVFLKNKYLWKCLLAVILWKSLDTLIFRGVTEEITQTSHSFYFYFNFDWAFSSNRMKWKSCPIFHDLIWKFYVPVFMNSMMTALFEMCIDS